MKFISVKSVVEAYKGFQDCMTNKSWGYLALLKGCKSSICPSVPYEVNLDEVSSFLENIFNLSQAKKRYSSGRVLYVVFSNKWDKYFNDQGRHTPNIYDVAIWAYRRNSFEDNMTKEEILQKFAEEFNIPLNIISNSFNTHSKGIEFTDSLYSETVLKAELNAIGVDVSKENIDAKKGSVVAAPGEISRGPFVQTLYAGLEITDYVIILQSDYLSLYGNAIKSINSIDHTSQNKYSNYRSYITAIKTKPFLLLAGISGTGKSRIVREFAFKSCPGYLQDKAGTTPGNYCMIEVKPNWHDSTELLGYYSRLAKAGYQFTKFVKFLVKAKMFPTVPFFVCLDEMNLAPVEQYFAEILSILETRKHTKNDKTGEVDMTTVKTEPIIDAQYFRELSEMPHTKNAQTGEPFCSNLTDRDIYLKLFGLDTENDIDEEVGNRTDLITEGLTLPDNVVIIGTVNMDDTTHQFSRKVIDRAMTIEMNGGNLRNMFGGSKNLEYLPEEEQEKWQNAFTCQYVTADEVLEAHSDVVDELMDKLPSKLEQINLALKGTPFEVSYRVLNELTIMVGVMLDEGMELDDAIAQSVNNILLMKILPRIEGDAEMFALSREYKTKVDVSYENRLEWLKDIAPDIKEPSADADSENDDSEEKTEIVKEHQQTAKEKIQEMIDRLNNQEFTRFWP